MSERSQDRSSEQGDLSYFPWLTGDLGYADYLAAADDRTWAQFLRRGASGTALLVSHVQPDFCCSGPRPAGRLVDATYQDTPWFLPALVRWHSPFDSDGDLLLDGEMPYWDESVDDICFPPVIVSDAWFVDGHGYYETMTYTNLVWGQMVDDEIQVISGIGQFDGLAYPWQMVPLTQVAHDAIYTTMSACMRSFETWVLSYGNCWIAQEDVDLEEDEHEEGDLPQPADPEDGVYEGHGCHECDYELGNGNCGCGRRATVEQIYIALMDAPLTGKDFLPEAYHPLWHYALTRYAAGWRAIHDRMTLGDPWSTSCWQQRSPFSGGDSLATFESLLLQGSTPSPASSDSSAA